MTDKPPRPPLDDDTPIEKDFVQMARLALAGREQDIQTFVQRAARRYRTRKPALASGLSELIRQGPSRTSPLRDLAAGLAVPAPVDEDSRLELVRHEFVDHLPNSPIWSSSVAEELEQLLEERTRTDALEAAGLEPTRTALFVGPPGVGKTLAARKLARDLGVPLLILDLTTVMSSLLGKTGSNLRKVVDYAKSRPSILLLDELDAVAKRRDDISEVGELKRLVTVLLQTIDDWPPTGLLLGATNHPDLLDPAVWRRFQRVIEFPTPDLTATQSAIRMHLREAGLPANPQTVDVLASSLSGGNFSDINEALVRLRRRSALSGVDFDQLARESVASRIAGMPYETRLRMAVEAVGSGRMTQRRASEVMAVSRDSIRSATKQGTGTVPSPTSTIKGQDGEPLDV